MTKSTEHIRTQERERLRAKVKAMCCIGYPGLQPGQETSQRLGEGGYGALGLFPHNILSEQQLQEACAELRPRGQASNRNVPLLSIDEEGGSLSNLLAFYPSLPGNRAIGLGEDPELAYNGGWLIGSQLRRLGIPMDWAPVLDVNSNPLNPVIGVRSFGEDPKLVADYGKAFIRGMRRAGILTTAKHFPGHGDVDADSHKQLPSSQATLDDLLAEAIVPFIAAISEGVDAIMVAHVAYPNIAESEGLPASLSPFLVNGILRERLGYNGVICTDDIEMHAIQNLYSPEEAGVLAVLAGNDQILMCHTPEYQERVVEGIVTAIEAGRLSEERIDASLERLGRLHDKSCELAAAADPIPYEQWGDMARSIAERSIRVERDPRHLLKLRAELRYLLVLPTQERLTQADSTGGRAIILADLLASRFPQLETVNIHLQPTSEDMDQVAAKLQQADVVLLGTLNAHRFTSQLELASLCAQERDTVVLVLRNPYDLDGLPEQSSVVLLCSTSDVTMEAFVNLYTE